jgi:hypothetical protein
MEKKFAITIEVDPETREIKVRDDAGNERSLKSMMIFGGNAEAGDLYLFGWGASADAAWAFRQGFLHSEESGDPGYRNFYRQCACHFVEAACPDELRPDVDPGEVLERWKAGDLRKPTVH